MTCDLCDNPAVVFIGIGTTGERFCQEHYDQWKAKQ